MSKQLHLDLSFDNSNTTFTGGIAHMDPLSLHAAARERNLELLSGLLLNSRVDEQDSKGNTPLHCLLSDVCSGETCKSNAVLCAELLLKAGADVNIENKAGEVPLYLAVKNEWEDCALVLLKWEADSTRSLEMEKGKVLALYLAERMPFVLAELMDYSSVRRSEDGSELLVDFSPILQYSKAPKSNDETEFIHSLLRTSSRTNFFDHPVTELFMRLKYHKLQVVILFSVLLHMVTLAFYTAYIIYLYIVVCPYNKSRKQQGCVSGFKMKRTLTNTTIYRNLILEEECVELCEKNDAATYMSIVLAVIWVILIISEIIMLKTRRFNYINKYSVLWIIFYVLMPITLYPSIEDDYYISTWRYPIAASGIWLVWALCIQQLGKIPPLAVYLVMFVKVSFKIMMLACLFFPLIIGYTVGFYVMGAENIDEAYSFLTVISVMVGEPSYDDFFDKARESSRVYEFVAYLMFFSFIVLMCVVFINFLIGLTISDIDELWEDAMMSSKKDQVRLMYLFDRVKWSFLNFEIFESAQSNKSGRWEFPVKVKGHPSHIPRTLVRKLKLLSARDYCSHHRTTGSASRTLTLRSLSNKVPEGAKLTKKIQAQTQSFEAKENLKMMHAIQNLESQVNELTRTLSTSYSQSL